MKNIFNLYAYNSYTPLIIDNPHSGQHLPVDFKYACDPDLLLATGDLHMEKLLSDVKGLRISMIEAKIHRSVIDLNRSPEDLKLNTLKEPWKEGFGLIPERLGRPFDTTPIYNKQTKPDSKEIKNRISTYYKPYHNTLKKIISQSHKTHGVTTHISMHSYSRIRDRNMADIIIGNDNGMSCSQEIRDFITDHFAKHGFSVAHNKPFSGGSLIKQHSNVKKNKHSLQIEIARDLYMNDWTFKFEKQKAQKLISVLNTLFLDLNKRLLMHTNKSHQNNKDQSIDRNYEP
jgi:N-formylglutamate amidohydrolase